MSNSDLDQTMRSSRVLEHEIPAGARGARAEFDHHGYGIGRGVFDPAVLRRVRAPLVEAIIADGYIEPVAGDEDSFRFVGDPAAFRDRYGDTVQDPSEELLIRTGAAAAAIETVWGRRAVFWVPGCTRLFMTVPGGPTRWHRDGWMMIGRGGPGDYVNIWIPLTRLGPADGPLGIAVGTQQMLQGPREMATPYPLHLDADLGDPPPNDVVAPLWATASYEVGDALVFNPYLVHSSVPNDGPYIRLAIALLASDAAISTPPKAGLSTDVTRDLVDVEWLVLSLLALQPMTPWLVRCAFYPRGIIGRLWTDQPDNFVETAVRSLHGRDLVEPYRTHSDPDAGIHRYFQATELGRKLACEWLTTTEPSDPRLLAVRLQLCNWLGLDSARLLSSGATVGVGG